MPTGGQRCRKGERERESQGEEVLPDIELSWSWMEPVRKEGNNLPTPLTLNPSLNRSASRQRSEGFLGSQRQPGLQAGEGGNSRELWCRRLLRIQGTARRLNQSILKEIIGRTDAEAEAPISWPPDAKSRLIGKDPDAGKEWRQEEKEATEDEMVGWHHQLDGHAFEQTLGDNEGQEALVCCSPWGWK